MRYFLYVVLLLSISFSGCSRTTPENQHLSDSKDPDNIEEAISIGLVDWSDSIQPQGLKAVKPKFKDPKSIKLASWNIRHLGKTKSAEEILYIANILRDFDIVAIQEVVGKDPAGAQAVAKIADELNRMGSQWDYQVSDPTKSPSPNISERYAFLWKTSKVSLMHRAYLDQEVEDTFYREPFIAQFKAKGKSDSFYIVNYHSRKYFDKPEEEIIHFIDYPKRLNSKNIIVGGDFNLDENHEVWSPLYHMGFTNALSNQPSTLKMKCKEGVYVNHAIDNLYFLPGIEKINAESLDFVQGCEYLELARDISDHLPIYMEFKLSENVN